MKRIASLLLISALAATPVLSASCAHMNVKAVPGAFVDCAKADFGQLGIAIAQIVAANSATLEQDLSQIALVVGTETVKCVVASLEAATTSTATPATSKKAPTPGLDRAKAWAAKH